MFYIVIFSILAVVLVVGGVTQMNRRRQSLATDEVQTTHGHEGLAARNQVGHTTRSDSSRRNRKAKRVQSRQARRKRH